MENNNNDRIKKYVKDILKMREWDEIMEMDKVRFSVTLDSLENHRLEVLLKKIGMKKTEFVVDAIKLLIKEFETQLELGPDKNPDYWKEIMSSYEKKTKLKNNSKKTSKTDDVKDNE